MEKVCYRCKVSKTVSEFNKNKSKSDGLQSLCRLCQGSEQKRQYQNNIESYAEYRKLNRKRKSEWDKENGARYRILGFGITVEQYNNMLEKQNHVCALCGGVNKDGRALSIDHDHKCCASRKSCGKCVRALLCRTCNTGIAFFKDNPQLLRSAADYVEKYSQR